MQKFVIRRTEHHPKGKLFTVIPDDHTIIQLLFLYHSLERIERWELKTEKVLETLLFPEEVLIGHRGRYIAHRRYGKHIVRAVYEYEDNIPALVTVYYPYTEQYFKGGNIYENQIFKRR